MTLSSDVEIIDIDSKSELVRFWEGISTLFLESFGKPLSRELWDWAYLDNPYGDPLVSIATCNNKVVGHYAVIPFDLRDSKASLSGFLSMTTMVSPDYRRLKLFQKLADRVYSRIEMRNNPAVVFGFPNDSSAPGFIKRLGWKILENYTVVKVKPGQVKIAKGILQKQLDSDGYKIDLSIEKARQWRLNKPGQKWDVTKGLGIKRSDFGNDLMYLGDLEHFGNLVGDSDINAILSLESDKQFEIAFPYRFGFRAFNMEIEPEFIVEMAMSDIF